jgi:hypothetical protein
VTLLKVAKAKSTAELPRYADPEPSHRDCEKSKIVSSPTFFRGERVVEVRNQDLIVQEWRK